MNVFSFSRLLLRRRLSAVFIVSLALGLSGCSYFSAQDQAPETVALPAQWSSHTAADGDPVKPWLSAFQSAPLESLVNEALAANPMLRSLTAGVDIAEDQSWLAMSAFWPKINAKFNANRNQRNNASGFSVASRRNNNVGFSLDFIWEIDLWYKLGNELEASEHDSAAAQSDLYAAQLSLAANLCKAWFEAVAAGQQVRLAEKTIVSFENALTIVEQGYDLGLYEALDVRLARSNMLSARGRKENFLKMQDQHVRNLEALAGRYPSAQLILPEHLPDFASAMPNSVPAELLQRRPDIIAAAQRFFASDQRLLKARKNMLPTIQISGNGGASTRKLDDIFNPEFLIWNIAGNLTQPLFHGSQLFAERSQAEARVKQAAADYAQIVLTALQEVETAMAAEHWLLQQQTLLQAQVVESKEAQRLAEDSYINGLTDIITLLEAQRRAFDAENNLLDMRKQRLHNRVNLYLALGGPVLETSLP